jgi:hypothetical protein
LQFRSQRFFENPERKVDRQIAAVWIGDLCVASQKVGCHKNWTNWMVVKLGTTEKTEDTEFVAQNSVSSVFSVVAFLELVWDRASSFH